MLTAVEVEMELLTREAAVLDVRAEEAREHGLEVALEHVPATAAAAALAVSRRRLRGSAEASEAERAERRSVGRRRRRARPLAARVRGAATTEVVARAGAARWAGWVPIRSASGNVTEA